MKAYSPTGCQSYRNIQQWHSKNKEMTKYIKGEIGARGK
jgi:hypothetical protein